MANYSFRYQLEGPPEARRDGSGQVRHDVQAVYKDLDIEGADWTPVPGRHQDILLYAGELQEALAQPGNLQKAQAYKQALARNLGTGAMPLPGWDIAAMTSFLDNNHEAQLQATDADDFITQDLGLPYPVRFAM